MADTETSPQTGATPATGPATGTKVADSAMQPATALTLDEALKKLAEHEHLQNNAKEELERHRKKLTAYEKQEKEAAEAKRLADEAQLSEIERTKKQFSDLQSEYEAFKKMMQDRIVRYEIEGQASKLGIIDPEAASALMNKSLLEFNEDGTPSNAEKLLKDLIKNKPYLAPAKPEDPPTTPAQTASQQQPPLTPAMNPGRSSIAIQGTPPQGQITRLDQIQFKRR
jgi:hypothetical protein